VEEIPRIPFTRASIASNLLVAVISTTRAEVPGILNLTVKPGKVRDGFNLTGSNGMSANPTNATQTKATINVKAEALGDFTISESIFCIFVI
jgi:pyruvate kinase